MKIEKQKNMQKCI